MQLQNGTIVNGVNMKYICKTEKDMEDLGKRLGKTFKEKTVVSLRGSLGAGKTVFARGVARALGIEEAVISPTFTLIQEYEGEKRLSHMDLYRIKSVDDFLATGGEELLYSDSVCLIEWSEVIEELLPKKTVYVQISINEDSSRTVEVQ